MSVFNKLFSKSASNAAKTVRNIADKLDNAANTVSSQTETTVSADNDTDTETTTPSADRSRSNNATATAQGDTNATITNSRVFVTEESHHDEQAQAMATELRQLANSFPRTTATVSLTEQNFAELQEHMARRFGYSRAQALSNSFTGSLFNHDGIVALRVATQLPSASGELCIELTTPHALWGGANHVPHIDSRIASIEYNSREETDDAEADEEDYQEENVDDYDDDEFTGYVHDYTQ